MRDGFRYKVMPIGKDRTAHPLWIDERRSLKYAVDLTWGESTEREMTLPVKVEKPAVRLTKGGAPPTRVVQTRKTFDQEVLELPLIDAADARASGPGSESASDSAAADESSAPLVLNPEDVIGEMVPEPPAADTLEPGALDPARQSLPVEGLSKVLRSRSEGIIAVGEGEKPRQVRYEGPRFQISGTVYFRVDQPVDSAPTIPTGSEDIEDEPVAFQYVGGDQEEGFVYPDDVL